MIHMTEKKTTRIGVVSDTHGLLREEVLQGLQGCDLILHAGDVGDPDILRALESICPVKAVLGNNDYWLDLDLPLQQAFCWHGLRICMTHRKDDLPADVSGYDLVVTGHSHRYAEKQAGHTLFLNPGSCGPRRFSQPVTFARITMHGKQLQVQRISIPLETRNENHTGQW
jgi:putative phosphoesterase